MRLCQAVRTAATGAVGLAITAGAALADIPPGESTVSGGFPWLWMAVGALMVLAVAALVALRRRR